MTSTPAGTYGRHSLSTAFLQAYVDQEINGVIDLAPETLNSLNELAAAINDDPSFYATVATQVAELNTDVTDVVTALGVAENDQDMGAFTPTTLPDNVTLKSVLEAFATAYETTKAALETADSTLSGRIDTLEADPTTAAAVAAVQADVDQNETDSDAADAALSGRLDTLEADPTTQTIVDALETTLDGRLDALEADPTTQTLLDAEETAREAADSALDARLDVLEADPTTATAVAAVQADVDQNEADADAAIAVERGRIDAILDSADADKDTFAEIVALINSVDTANDNAFAGYVTSNDAAVAAVQADVDQNEADADAAIAALQADVDQNEADADAAIAAVQADVDQNEADADAAIALKLNAADPAATGKLTVDTNASLEFDSNLTKLHNELRGTRIDIGNNITLYPAAANGRVEVEGEFYLRPSDLTDAADDTAAAAAGIIVGQVYRNGSQLMVRVS